MRKRNATQCIENLSLLLRAQVPLLDALTMMNAATRSKSYGLFLHGLIDDVTRGVSLADSLLRGYKDIQPIIYTMIRVGESSGTLEKSLAYLCRILEQNRNVQKKILTALLYPCIVGCGTLGILAMLVLYIFPKILPMFKSMHTDLPWSTRLVIAISDVITAHGMSITVGIMVACICIYATYAKSLKSRYAIHFAVMYVPILNTLVLQYQITQFARIANMLISSGMTVEYVIKSMTNTTRHLVYIRAYTDIYDHMSRGIPLSTSLAKYPRLFPRMSIELITIGEKTSNLNQSFRYITDQYDSLLEEYTKVLPTLLEPVLMVVMGSIVGFIAVSIITPMYAITQNIHR